ncbi:MAG: glutamyl-tRNA reductase [Ktedonobacteraceae bacterium]
MHIVVVGVDHTTASIALREHLACSARQTSQLLHVSKQISKESVLLSTCNRVELYAVCDEAIQGRSDLLHVLSETRQVAYDELENHCYSFTDEQAVSHLFGVTSGLYSLVPGEAQIQGQVVEALEIAQGGGYAGPITSALFRAALVAGKRARSETGISRNAASVSHVAVQLAKRLLPDFSRASVLLIGSGKMSELAARNLRDNGAERLVIVNRTQTHAMELAQSLQAIHRPFSELTDALVEADVVISSTQAPHPIVTRELAQQVLATRGGRSLLLIDIALPRDIESSVGDLSGVHLYNLDDLQAQVDRGIQLRLQEIEHVRAIIAEEVSAFERWLASLSVVGTINDLRQHADALRQQELARTMRQISPGLSEREIAAIQELTNRFMNKLLHTPMLRLKDAATAGQGHVYAEAMRFLFDLEENPHENNAGDAGKQARNVSNALDNTTTASALAQS